MKTVDEAALVYITGRLPCGIQTARASVFHSMKSNLPLAQVSVLTKQANF